MDEVRKNNQALQTARRFLLDLLETEGKKDTPTYLHIKAEFEEMLALGFNSLTIERTQANDEENSPANEAGQSETLTISKDQQLLAEAEKKAFLENVVHINADQWYQDGKRHRRMVDDAVDRTARILTRKTVPNMHDIQTARLYLFEGVPDDSFASQAFEYTQSLYDRAERQGFLGSGIQPAT